MTKERAMPRRGFVAILAVAVLCSFVPAAAGQTKNSDRVPVQSNSPVATIRVESNLVVVPVVVYDEKHLAKGMTEAEERCA
jgi:hypothetical protein